MNIVKHLELLKNFCAETELPHLYEKQFNLYRTAVAEKKQRKLKDFKAARVKNGSHVNEQQLD